MKKIEIDDGLYHYLASQTQDIGESASLILRRLLKLPMDGEPQQAITTITSPQSLSDMTQSPISSVNSERVEEVSPLPSIVPNSAKVIRAILISDEFASYHKAIQRFMMLLSALYQLDQEGFAQAVNMRGRTRVYFADNHDVLSTSGKTTKPKLIPGTPYWVITNNNTERKRKIVEQVMVRMGFEADLVDKVCQAI